jgi:hypothetical protein
MLQPPSREDALKEAERIGHCLRALLFSTAAEIMEFNNEQEITTDPSTGQPARYYINPLEAIQNADVFAATPDNAILSSFLGERGILLITLASRDPAHVLAAMLPGGYHVVPTAHVQEWKQAVMTAFQNAKQEVIDYILDAHDEEEQDEQQGEQEGPGLLEEFASTATSVSVKTLKEV